MSLIYIKADSLRVATLVCPIASKFECGVFSANAG
jgi:hypothetical protein